MKNKYRNHKIFGLSATSVLRRLGQAGFTTRQARQAVRAIGSKVSDVCVNMNVPLGRKADVKWPLAELTAAQLAKLRKLGGVK